jgi:hypothetical protein
MILVFVCNNIPLPRTHDGYELLFGIVEKKSQGKN